MPQIVCDVCQRDVTLHTQLFECLVCVGFYWCSSCFYNTSTEKLSTPADRQIYGSPQVQATKSWHNHPFRLITVDIRTPKGERYVVNHTTK